MTKMLKRLEKVGLVERTPAPNDGRSRLVALTDAGFELQEEIFKVFLTRTKELLQSISPRQLEDIDSSLRDLLEATESYFYR
jgi:DNA-binding MarR family transcriptional regulator